MKNFPIKFRIWWHRYIKRHWVEEWTHPLSAENSFFCIRCHSTENPFGGSYVK